MVIKMEIRSVAQGYPQDEKDRVLFARRLLRLLRKARITCDSFEVQVSAPEQAGITDYAKAMWGSKK